MTEPLRPIDLDRAESPKHPTARATLLMIGVFLLIVALAALSTWGTF